MKDGKPNGHGSFWFRDGGKFVGSWKNGIAEGEGIQTYATGPKGNKADCQCRETHVYVFFSLAALQMLFQILFLFRGFDAGDTPLQWISY